MFQLWTRSSRAVFLLRAAAQRWGIMSAGRRTLLTLREGGVPAVAMKLRNLARLERDPSSGAEDPASVRAIRKGAAHPDSASRLDQDFGMEYSCWERYLLQHTEVPADADRRPDFWVLVSGEPGSPEVTRTCASVTRAGLDPRAIQVSTGDGFSCAVKSLLARADARDLVWFMEAGDEADSRSRLLLARAARADADLYLFDTYFVEDNRAFPQLHPGFNEIFGLNCNYFRSRFLARVGALRRAEAAAPLADAYGTAQTLLALRLQGNGISGIHLPSAFVRIEDSRAAIAQESRYLICNDVAQFGAMSPNSGANPNWKVSVVICTRDMGHLLRQTVRSMMETAGNLIGEVVVVSHATQNPYALKTIADLRQSQVRIVPYEGPFNFSRQCNVGAQGTMAPYILFLNDDITPVTSDWLERLLAPFDNPAVGATGPLLLYPDESVQHAGMFLGHHKMAGHTLRSARLPDDDYLFMTQAPRQVSCLTGAAMLLDRRLFDDLNGFDPLLGTDGQDVDLSLRIGRSGRQLVFNPQSILLHMESTSLRDMLPAVQATRQREHGYFVRRWGDQVEHDPFHNPNFDLQVEDLRSLRPYDTPPPPFGRVLSSSIRSIRK
jgi:GT2 family glycosyltransferase